MLCELDLNEAVKIGNKSKYGRHFNCYNIYIIKPSQRASFVDSVGLSQVNIPSGSNVLKNAILNNCIT